MKKILLISVLLVAFNTSFSQTNPCVPELTLQDSLYNLWPDTIENLPIANVDVYYETHVQIKTPDEVGEVTGYPYEVDLGLPFLTDVSEIKIDSIKMVEVIGLPDGMSLYHSSANATYLGNSVGCVTLYGNTTAEMIGTHDIVFKINGWVSVAGQVVALTDVGDLEEIMGYKFIVSEDGTASLINSNTSKFNLEQNIPNPFNNHTTILFTSDKAETVTFQVVDVLGKVVYYKNMFANVGSNTIELSTSDFDSGLYYYTLTNSESSLSKRMIVNK